MPSSDKTNDATENNTAPSVVVGEKYIEVHNKDNAGQKVTKCVGPQLKEALRDKLNSIKRKTAISIPELGGQVSDGTGLTNVMKIGVPSVNKIIIDQTFQLEARVDPPTMHKQNIKTPACIDKFPKPRKEGITTAV